MPRSRKNGRSMQHICSGVKGVVTCYRHDDHYGFIKDDMGRDPFFHISGLKDHHRQQLDEPVRVGDEVIFDLYLAPKGYRAESVQVLNLVRVEDIKSECFDNDDLLYENEWFQVSSERPPNSPQRATGAGDNHNQGQGKGGEGNVSGRTGKQRKRGRRGGRNRNHLSPNNDSRESNQQPRKAPTCTSDVRSGKGKDTKSETSHSPNRHTGSQVNAEPTCTCTSGDDRQPNVAASTSTELSWSAKQRERGNVFYKSATDDFSSTVRISRLGNAITCYGHALSCSETKDEEASALKNIGMAYWKLAAIALEGETEDADKIILKHFKDAWKHFCMAYVLRSFKSTSWGDKLEDSWENCLEESTEWLATLDTTERIAGFSEMLNYVPDCRLKADGYIQYSTLLFHEGLTSWQNGAYKECYRYMRECYYPIQEAERLCEAESSIKTEVGILQEDVYIHTCMAESSMARATGDDLLEEHLKNEETLNTDTVWTVIDFYKQSAVLCRDKDLEQEAIAYSRLGRVYGSVLNLSSRGKDYYKKAIQLALSMTPRNFHGVDWFKESTEFVEDFQKRLNKDEEEDKDQEAALTEMKDDVDKLTKMADEMDDVEFIKELYQTWPPKASGAKLDDSLAGKKLLLKAISHYHPDKVDKEVHGKNWFYFSGEITKHLNIKYGCYKSVD